MYKSLTFVVVSLVCCPLLLHATTQENSTSPQCPPEDPPQILVASSIDSDDQLVLVSYHSIFIGFEGDCYNERLTKKVSLEEVQISTADGNEVTLEEARKVIADRDTPILATSYKMKLPEFFAQAFASETLVFVFSSQAPEWREIEAPGARVR